MPGVQGRGTAVRKWRRVGDHRTSALSTTSQKVRVQFAWSSRVPIAIVQECWLPHTTVPCGEDRGTAVMSWVQYDLPHSSIPPLPKANLAGKRLQTGHDRSLRSGLYHAVPAAKLPAARCFRGGMTLRERSLSPLTPPRQVPCPIHCRHFAKTAPTEASASLWTSSRTTNTSSKAIFAKVNYSKTYALMMSSLVCVVTHRMLVEGRRPHLHQGTSLKYRKFIFHRAFIDSWWLINSLQ
jgi:hypothetical protein